MNTVTSGADEPLPRFYVKDDPERINRAHVFDRGRNHDMAVTDLSKSEAESAAALLNAWPIPKDGQPYQQTLFRAKVSAKRVRFLAQSFETGVNVGITLGDDANTIAEMSRDPARNAAYTEGVLFGQRVLKGQIKMAP